MTQRERTTSTTPPIRPSRRTVLRYGAAFGGAAALGTFGRFSPVGAVAPAHGIPTPLGTLFTLGVASGEPRPQSVVLWTRLAPDPVAQPLTGGMPSSRPVVEWQLASDPSFSTIVKEGSVRTGQSLGYSVRHRVAGLEPGTEYWYRFRHGGDISMTGRTKTAPGWGRSPEQLRFASVSCAHYESGEYSAYARGAEEDLDFWLHLGDYIYEGDTRSSGRRQHNPIGKRELETLAEYRARWSLYKLDPALQALHAVAPVIHVNDDHEVENNHAGLIDEDDQTDDVQNFREQRANAYEAMWEHLPYTWRQRPVGSQMRIRRDLVFGDLLLLAMLDTRQYRTDQLELLGRDVAFFPPDNPEGTMLGDNQEAWLVKRLAKSPARWNALGQQVMMTQAILPIAADDPINPLGIDLEIVNTDAWDGYGEARERLLGAISEQGTENLVALSGDIHASFVSDLIVDRNDPANTVVGSEFTCTSITSNFGEDGVALFGAAAADGDLNPTIKYFNGGEAVQTVSADEHHGYHLHTVTADEWRCDIREVADVDTPDASVSTIASFVVESGVPGPQPA